MLLADVLWTTRAEDLLWLTGAVLIAHLISLRYQYGLSKFGGPFLASFTNFWRMCHAYANNDKAPMVDLHKKYGDVVRVGPNVLSFAQPEAIKDIYGPGKVWRKVRINSFNKGQSPTILTLVRALSQSIILYKLP